MYNKLKFLHRKTQSVFFCKFLIIRLLSRRHPAANPSPPFPLCPAAGQRGRGGEGLAEAQLPHIFQDGVSPFAPGRGKRRDAILKNMRQLSFRSRSPRDCKDRNMVTISEDHSTLLTRSEWSGTSEGQHALSLSSGSCFTKKGWSSWTSRRFDTVAAVGTWYWCSISCMDAPIWTRTDSSRLRRAPTPVVTDWRSPRSLLSVVSDEITSPPGS